jgi:Zn-dependent protease with chaperone function
MKNHLKTILLISALSALVIGLGTAVAPSFAYLFVAIAVAMNIGAYFFSDKLVLRMHGARELNPTEVPEIHVMLSELAVRAKIPKPRLYIIADRQPNAFATGRNPEHGVVAITEGIVEILTMRELRGVGAQISGDPEALASALTKLERGSQLFPTEQPHPATSSMFIVNPLSGSGAVFKLFSTHPSTEERVSRLLAMARARREPAVLSMTMSMRRLFE